MARRKKHPRLPNGYGSIKFLGKGRRNPYGVYPPAREINEETGNPITPPAICYVDDWLKGFMVLTAYKAGTYTPGYELTLNLTDADQTGLEELSRRILADYGQAARRTFVGKTFAEVYAEFYQEKFASGKTFSKSTKDFYRAAYKHCQSLYDLSFSALRTPDLQQIVDGCGLRHAGQEMVLNLLKQMYKYAIKNEIVDRDYSQHVSIKTPDDDEHGVPFTDTDLATLWQHRDDPTVEMLLIMCYSGFRITAYKTMEVSLEERYFRGGVKTTSGKNRIVPIHSAIYDLVRARLDRDGCLLKSTTTFRREMKSTLAALGIVDHTPHDCRHTFSYLCEKFGVKENDRKRMLGHAFRDITNKTYGHRDLESLRVEIEKIRPPEV